MAARQVHRTAAACGLLAGLILGGPADARQAAAPVPQSDGLRPPAYVAVHPPPGVTPVVTRTAAPAPRDGDSPGAQQASPPPYSPGLPAAKVPIPAGEFWMGRTRLRLMDEIGWQVRERFDDRPVHRVRLDAFTIDAWEVTNGDYARFVANPSSKVEPPFHWGGPAPPPGKARLPVYNVSWHDASRYCAAQGGRLPTEAEWEYAARGGVADLDYPWGNEYTDTTPDGTSTRRAHAGSSTGPRPVGSFAPNAYGLYDMSGNVWEWTADWYDLLYYAESPVENPTGPRDGRYKVIRGGSWADTETRLGTVYYRNFTAPDTAQPTIGFRCVAPAPSSH